jgi:LemA protein
MNTKKLFTIIPIVLIVMLIFIIIGTAISSYNGTVKLREAVDANESEIENRLQQRHDKMEQIISAIQGLQDHAEDLYKMITDARAAYAKASSSQNAADYQEADALESEVITRLLVVVEDNPTTITATNAYNAYIDEVSAMENTLAVARRDYNNSVKEYNIQVKKFPKVLYLSLFGFEKQLNYWKIEDGADEVPTADFID